MPRAFGAKNTSEGYYVRYRPTPSLLEAPYFGVPTMSLNGANHAARANGDASSAPGDDGRILVARWLYWSRGVRSETLSPDLFGEPAWDILLDLYIREKSGARSSVTSACIGSRAPHTTALRHISALAKAGWVARIPDDADKRRFWLALTPSAITKLDGHFDRLAATASCIPTVPHPVDHSAAGRVEAG